MSEEKQMEHKGFEGEGAGELVKLAKGTRAMKLARTLGLVATPVGLAVGAGWATIWFMGMTPQVFQQTASGVQSLAVALAMVVGAAWAVYEFVVRRRDRKADKDAEVELRRAEINGEFEASVQPGMEPGTWLINVRHTFVNGGERGITIRWARAPLRVASVKPVDLGDDGRTWKPEGRIEHHNFSGFDAEGERSINPRSTYLGPGLTHVLRALVPVERPGVYQLIFEYDLVGKERDEAGRELERLPGGLRSWDFGFVIVRPSPAPTDSPPISQ